MARIVRLVLQLLDQLHLLGEVLRVGVIESVVVGGLPEPVRVCSKLIWEVSIIVFQGVFLYVFLGVG